MESTHEVVIIFELTYQTGPRELTIRLTELPNGVFLTNLEQRRPKAGKRSWERGCNLQVFGSFRV